MDRLRAQGHNIHAIPRPVSRIHAGPASQNAQEMQIGLRVGLCDPPGFNRPTGNAP
jgi:hypothetical protein